MLPFDYTGAGDILTFSESFKPHLISIVKEHFKENPNIPLKTYLSLNCKFENIQKEETFEHYITSKPYTILGSDEVSEASENILSNIQERFDQQLEIKSGAVLRKISNGALNIMKTKPVRIGSFVKTPKKFANKLAIININMENEDCFKNAAAIHISRNKMKKIGTKSRKKIIRETLRNQTRFDFSMLSTPVKLNELNKFEKVNKINVHIFAVNASALNPFRISKQTYAESLNLLLIESMGDDEDSEYRYHFAYIQSLERLLNTQKTNFVFCNTCLSGFDKRYSGEKRLKEHQEHCNGFDKQDEARVVFPQPGEETIGFKNFFAMQEPPLTLYADFESVLIKENIGGLKESENRKVINTHECSGYSIVPVFHNYFDKIDTDIYQESYSGEDAINSFYEKLEEIAEKYDELFEKHCRKKIDLTKEEWRKFKSAGDCYLCRQSFSGGVPSYVASPPKTHNKYNIVGECVRLEEEDIETFNAENSVLPLQEPESGLDPSKKVRDHCHISGKYRGAAHAGCNLRLRLKKTVTVFFHNLSKYDAHHIVRHMGSIGSIKDISVIGKTLERFSGFSFKINEVKFIFRDSLQHLSSSLEALTKNLIKSSNVEFYLFKNTRKMFEKYQEETMIEDESFKLLTQKGVFPYTYISNFNVLEETQLPGIEDFFNDLAKTECTLEEYAHAQKVWEVFKCKTIKDYQNLYMLLDTALLADIFENYRSLSRSKYGLDPVHYFTSPSLSWDACLKTTGVEIDLITDVEMNNFFDRGFFGGVSFARTPYMKANNPHCEDYDETKPQSHMILVDSNNLYGHSMMQPLPYGSFSWVEEEEFTSTNEILSLDDNGENGYMFEVSLDYPFSLHEKHSQYPLAPEHYIAEDKDLSDWQKQKKKEFNIKPTKKLCLTLKPKEKYVLHQRNLKLYLRLGMKLKTIHKILKFKQFPYMKKYIEINTEIRRNGGDKCTKDLAKLFNNSCFGKTCEDVTRYKTVILYRGEEQAELVQRRISSPFFEQIKLYDDKLVAVQMKKHTVFHSKPRYIGQVILSLSKIVMYSFHYDIMQKYFENIQLGFTDTDSFCYLIQYQGDFYKKLKEIDEKENIFDFSNYPKTHENYNTRNYLVPGKFKDEGEGIPYVEGVFLRSKMYSLKSTKDCLSKSTAKGIDRHTKEREINHKSYLDCLFNDESKKVLATRILNDGHHIYTVNQKKEGLSNFNDKVWIDKQEDGTFKSLPFGYNYND